VIVLNWEGFYTPLLAMMDHMHTEGFMYDGWRNRTTVAKDAEAVMQTINAWSE
jgi:predicted Rossmann-fold nucleotide-binding protein